MNQPPEDTTYEGGLSVINVMAPYSLVETIPWLVSALGMPIVMRACKCTVCFIVTRLPRYSFIFLLFFYLLLLIE